jgi:hypothetical protein
VLERLEVVFGETARTARTCLDADRSGREIERPPRPVPGEIAVRANSDATTAGSGTA